MYVLMCACVYVGVYVELVELGRSFLVIQLLQEFGFLCACKYTEYIHTQYELNLPPTPGK